MQLRPHTLILGLCILAPAASAELLVQVDSSLSMPSSITTASRISPATCWAEASAA